MVDASGPGVRVVLYFVLAWLLSWADWIPMALGGRVVEVGGSETHMPGLLGPMLAAIIMTVATTGRAGLRELGARMVRWRIGWRGWALALSPLPMFLVAALVAVAAGEDWPAVADLGRFNGFPEIGPLGVWALLILVGGFGEETGWRGYALEHLEKRFGALAGTLVLAVGWALWHVPSFFVIDTYIKLGAAGMPGFLLGMMSGAIVLTWIYHRCRRSILAVAVWHGTFNLTSGTLAARGTIAAIVSTGVMVWAVVLVILELRARRRGAEVLAAG
jgi:CAAX protease family protein